MEWLKLVGCRFGMNNKVEAFASADSNQLFAGGAFTTAGSNTAPFAAGFSASWSSLGAGCNSIVYAADAVTFGIGNVTCYFGGAFTIAGGNTTNHVAYWLGGGWG